MTFKPQQIDSLCAPLNRADVKGRNQGGRTVNYIEGWHAIAEANRIFGYDGWDRDTITMALLGEPREVNGNIRVDYMAKVRVTAGGRFRDGCGFGQGIDKDVGKAHESAIKEAETDAMKRALMTFGNPFGLALYDKDQGGVSNETPFDEPEEPVDIQVKRRAGVVKRSILKCVNDNEVERAVKSQTKELNWIKQQSQATYEYIMGVAEDHKKSFLLKAG